MDSFLIDFNSPKQGRENALLIPEKLVGAPSTWNAPMLFSSTEIESNPFDLVEGQVAANTAAENDPFEMVLSNAINCKESESKDNKAPTLEFVNNSVVSPKAITRSMSLSLPDLQKLPDAGLLCKISAASDSSKTKNPSALEKVVNTSDRSTYNIAAWNCLEDITPPDYLLNSTVDMTCFLDDTLSTSIINVATLKDTSILLEENSSPSVKKTPPELKENHLATYKSDQELRLLAQKKIECLINKAEQDVQNDIEESLVQRRRSIQSLNNPSQEILALCTPRKQSTDQTTWSLEKWSENELKKLDLILPDTSNKSASSRNDSALAAYLSVPSLKFEEELCLSSVKMVTSGGNYTRAPKSDQLTPVKQKSLNNLMSETGSTKKISSLSPSSMSPTLLPLPLCEDAVRNLSLCSKYSPQGNSLDQLKIGNPQKITANSSKEPAKITLRKLSIAPKTQSKMAPMKATAPVQNMTRVRSSLLPSSKPLTNIVSGRKSTLKEPCPKPSTNQAANSKSLRMGHSPSRGLSGSLPNLSSQGSKPPTKLPSPRRSGSTLPPHVPVNLKKRLESTREINSHQGSGLSSSFHHSPRPLRKGSPCRTGNHARVLAEINTCSSARMSPKCRVNQSETPRRGRSMVTEKENYL